LQCFNSIACHSLADDQAITIEANELEVARWFTRSVVSASMAGDPEAPFLAPPPMAIAHQLLR